MKEGPHNTKESHKKSWTVHIAQTAHQRRVQNTTRASVRPLPTRAGPHVESMPDGAWPLGPTPGALGHTAILQQCACQSPRTAAPSFSKFFQHQLWPSTFIMTVQPLWILFSWVRCSNAPSSFIIIEWKISGPEKKQTHTFSGDKPQASNTMPCKSTWSKEDTFLTAMASACCNCSLVVASSTVRDSKGHELSDYVLGP